MTTRHIVVTLVVASACATALACGGEDAGPSAVASPAASAEVQRLVAEIDAMLAVPQDEYPDGNEYSAMFEQLLEHVMQQRRTLRTNQVTQNMGYFIAKGHGIGWDPQEADVANLAGHWSEFRSDVLAGP